MPPLLAVFLVVFLVTLLTLHSLYARRISRRAYFFSCTLFGLLVWLAGLPKPYPSQDAAFASLGVLGLVGVVAGLVGLALHWSTLKLRKQPQPVNGIIRIARFSSRKRVQRAHPLPSPASTRQLVFCAECGCWTTANFTHNHSRLR
ncbi:MAG: hypothetical protein HXX08_18660 [Chloroflexi bacterium]|uniref:Uncharacterized protein n=1 Tax=Candidatus Chlorohelix allophototropha TaxID=3003348 RepID=A0A8T7M6V2_9CHLR|nr:hypothetical protein [Chloroflexota bacterium]WJW69784.1 hypothetical protein OZ401_003414 [Chloroflexota bacterium L227-S17]